MILCWAAKGGSGTTVVASALALLAARSEPTTLVDLAGDCPVALGLTEPSGPGLIDWLGSPSSGAAALARLTVTVTDGLLLLPRGHGAPPGGRWAELGAALGELGNVIIDAGTGPPPPELLLLAGQSLLVTRPCFLALRRATQQTARPTGVVLINEPGRALRAHDVEHALGVAVVAEVLIDPAVSRAVDAGLLASRLPRALVQQLRGAA